MIEARQVSKTTPLTEEDAEIYLRRMPAVAMLVYRAAHRGDAALMFMATDEAAAMFHVEHSEPL